MRAPLFALLPFLLALVPGPAAAQDLDSRYFDGSSLPPSRIETNDAALAGKLSACKAGDGDACTSFALSSRIKGADNAEIDQAFVRGCELKPADVACGHAAMVLTSKGATAASLDRALALTKRYCPPVGAGLACSSAKEVLMRVAFGYPELASAAAKASASEELCARKVGEGCTGLAFSQLQAKGEDADIIAVLGLAQRGCDYGAGDGCILAANLMQHPKAPPADFLRFRATLARTCELPSQGDWIAPCQAAMQQAFQGYNGENADPVMGRELAMKSCGRGDGVGCLLYATATFEGLGGAKDIAAARQQASRTCEAGMPEGCALKEAILRDVCETDSGSALCTETKAFFQQSSKGGQ